jgi:hypothetical protein
MKIEEARRLDGKGARKSIFFAILPSCHLASPPSFFNQKDDELCHVL